MVDEIARQEQRGGDERGQHDALVGIAAFYVALCWWATSTREPAAVPARGQPRSAPNIVLIGSDTLRADRLFGGSYRRELTERS